jgi:hypothetical protein
LLTRPGIPPMRVKSEKLPTKKHLEDMKPVADNNKRCLNSSIFVP